jgi:putative oxidoreductase
MGPGDWSLDAPLGHRLNRPWMSAVAMLGSAAVSLAIVRRRSRVLAAQVADAGGETPQVASADAAADATDAP